MWGLGTTQIVILRTFRPIILQTNSGKRIFGKTQLDHWASQYFGKFVFGQNNILATWYFGKMILWQNDIVAKQDFCNMIIILWQNDFVAKQYVGKIISWDTHWPLSKQTHCSKQTILQICSRNSRNLNGRRTTNPKVFDLHRKNKARTSWSKRTPQEPELCATKSDFDLLIRLRRTARCAKGGARLSCVLSLRVPGRRDAAVHEHALKSCAAHTGFPCKNRSAKLEFEMFWSWKPCQLIFLSVYVAW